MFHRYACTALEEMREALKHVESDITKRHLGSLVEELQTMFNRMENELEARVKVEHYEKQYKRLKAQIRELKKDNIDIDDNDVDIFWEGD